MADVHCSVVRHPFPKEIGPASQRDYIHEVERVHDIVHLVVAERYEQTVHDEFHILAHERRVHADELAWQNICKTIH